LRCVYVPMEGEGDVGVEAIEEHFNNAKTQKGGRNFLQDGTSAEEKKESVIVSSGAESSAQKERKSPARRRFFMKPWWGPHTVYELRRHAGNKSARRDKKMLVGITVRS